ncbi:hypothetical protein LTR91_017742 [Friedmanniomyces endolithicus]|uniref:Enoyl reductase (ER) domain-containing protein n=1 Tax=Friedmanniomyces endolithicus TaxID=329885 RepID=A0AAN6K5N1_9PEZI|nr:hypothetical protein LTR94_012291 [Friedmanniomyces endolithicus]KAK0809494.1 hypothetical protein LTR75_005935 [Friedmanniomyces endolithicus]KAK0812311.1 hypothetical protein LTR38_003332 [Friedmanniomyces endolithicus]KAK0813313.1 hypothetical protein LTR59_001097 [Friedmanniomyces endolithicus]KAK0849503.1 hypothetical protein LTR03_005139 [Friedmanniomyces endolithicus]
MTASVTEAAKANSELDPAAGKITLKATAGKGTMRAGQWDPVRSPYGVEEIDRSHAGPQEQKKVVIREVSIPEAGPGQFLVKIASASLCHSDIISIEANNTATLGHEGAGYIEKMHASVEDKGFNVGDPIGFLYIIGCCFECEGCMIHNLHCVTGKQLLQGFTTDGFFAEYAVVDYQNAMKLPESIDIKTASPIFCAGITAFHAVDNAELKEGDWMAVVGAGGLGQQATQIAKAMGFKVVALDVNDATLEVCKKQGADAVFNSMSNKDYVEELKKLTSGGVKAACVFSNADAVSLRNSAHTVRQLLIKNQAYAGVPSILRLGGVMMVIGLPHNPLKISSMDLALGKYKVKSESTSIPQRMKKAVEFLAKHNIKPEVQQRKLDDLNDMVTEMREGKATKRMLVNF